MKFDNNFVNPANNFSNNGNLTQNKSFYPNSNNNKISMEDAQMAIDEAQPSFPFNPVNHSNFNPSPGNYYNNNAVSPTINTFFNKTPGFPQSTNPQFPAINNSLTNNNNNINFNNQYQNNITLQQSNQFSGKNVFDNASGLNEPTSKLLQNPFNNSV